MPLQGTSRAIHFLFAMLLAIVHNQGMKSVVKLCVPGKPAFAKALHVHIGLSGVDRITPEQPHRIGIHYKSRKIKGIQQNGIRRLVANAPDLQQFSAQVRQGAAFYRIRIAIIADKPFCDGFQVLSLLPEITCGADDLLKLRDRG